ncbi:putative Polycomb group protein ASXL2 isoform X2 [Nematolebias whitei]|uniref:putative Polycomb group protein ASXL2 isoform X2 n=1 Tax=Nematolebias whitei TaxID=451745 RepID=UPI001896B1ED|nr:putative Polycomb group protein ASXL2 isoform X2 [Nematolebias whitei]
MRERQKKKKGRTWAEAAKTVLEKYPNTPMSHKEILQVIQRERLKEISGTSPLACLNAMLHTNSRGEEGIFYKVPGRMGVYTLKKDSSDVRMSEELSDESSDNLSDSRSTEKTSVSEEGRTGRWLRRVPSKLQPQPSSPQPQCSSPPVSTSKLISPSQKHSKKALKQALKQQQQRNQRRQGGMPTISSSRLLLKTIKEMTENITTKTELCHPVVPRKVSQRSGGLSAGQIKRTKYKIDVETPDSILVNTNLRAIINKHTFSILPPDCQQKLLKLLPEVDRQACLDGLLKVTSSALNNEFFTSAAQSWKERLAEGEFTPELQLRMRQEIEKEKKVEHWKEAFFERYYGENSGLSYVESKELTKAESNQRSARSRTPPDQTRPVAKARADTKDRSQMDSAANDVKSTKTLQEPLKGHPGQKESISEPMRTRRSHNAEVRKLSSSAEAAGSTPAGKTPEVEKRTENVSPVVPPEKEHKKERQPEVPQSPVKESPPPKTGPDQREDQLDAVVKPAVDSKDIVMEASGVLDAQKRKSPSETDGEETPEKRPRLSSVSSVSSVSSASPSASAMSSPATPSSTSQRVSPLKIPVSRILPVPLSPNQISPKPALQAPLSSPGRTGARTLADIKAKAQLARAQRAAAAAASASSASKGVVPGPGPGGGVGDQRQPRFVPTLTSPQALTRLPATPTSCTRSGTPSPCPVNSLGLPSSDRCQTDDVHKGHAVNSVSTGLQHIQKSSNTSAQPSSTPGTQEQVVPKVSGSLTRISSYIPANNPLVTQLLQGKEVPLEQILPKPLSTLPTQPSAGTVKTHGVELKAERPLVQQVSTGGQAGVFSEYAKHKRELPSKETQEQILQALMQRNVRQLSGGLGPQSSQHRVRPMMHTEEHLDQSRVSVGFLRRNRVPRPAMTGHYLLNVSTYGRGAESKKLSLCPTRAGSSVKREGTGREEAAVEEPPGSGVKAEPQGCSVTKCDDRGNVQHCSTVKTEPGSEASAAGGDTTTCAKAKDTVPFSQLRQNHLELCNQGNSEPYLSNTDPSHQRPTAFQSQRTLGNQEPAVAACYGGTVSVSVPHTLNHSAASTEADGGICGSVMSFSVTVTTIPANSMLERRSPGEPSPNQSFTEGSDMEDVQSKCYCRLKAMIMCKGCGAFCHDDCIGPSKLCVSCLVVQ